MNLFLFLMVFANLFTFDFYAAESENYFELTEKNKWEFANCLDFQKYIGPAISMYLLRSNLLGIHNSEGQIKLIDLITGKVLYTLDEWDFVKAMQIFNNKILIVALKHAKVIFFDLAKKEVIECLRTESDICGMQLIDNDKTLAIGLKNGKIVFHDVLTYQKNLDDLQNDSTVWSIQHLEGNLIAVGLDDGKINIWNFEDKKLEKIIDFKIAKPIHAMQSLPENCLAATLHNSVYICDLNKAAISQVFQTSSPLWGLQLTSGNLLASCLEDGGIMYWKNSIHSSILDSTAKILLRPSGSNSCVIL